jgi:enoyl-CoA hydratase
MDAVGVARTREIFLLGRNMDAAYAEHIGLVNEVVPDEELAGRALGIAEEIAGNAPLSMKGNKEIIRRLASFRRLDEGEEQEVIDLRLSSFRTEDFKEGVRAFGEKRKPVWRGR